MQPLPKFEIGQKFENIWDRLSETRSLPLEYVNRNIKWQWERWHRGYLWAAGCVKWISASFQYLIEILK